MTKEDGGDGDMCLSRTLRDMVLDADSSSLREVIGELGIDPNDVVRKGKMAAARALQLTASAAKSDRHDGGRNDFRIMRGEIAKGFFKLRAVVNCRAKNNLRVKFGVVIEQKL